jgi:hypothetical protein
MKCVPCQTYFAAYSHNRDGECDCPPCQGYCGCCDTQGLLKAALYALDDVHACDEPELPDATLARVASSIDKLRRVLGVENATRVVHAEGCWSWGPAHYACACAEVAKLKGWGNGR